MMTKLMLTPQQVGALAGCTAETVRRAVEDGKLDAKQAGTGAQSFWRIAMTDAKPWAAARREVKEARRAARAAAEERRRQRTTAVTDPLRAVLERLDERLTRVEEQVGLLVRELTAEPEWSEPDATNNNDGGMS